MQIKNIILDETKRETTQHGSFDFPFALYTTQINQNILGHIAWHWHEELQFCLVTQGIVDFFIRNSAFTLRQGEGIFINVEQIHQSKNHPGNDSTYFCINFHPRMLCCFPGSVFQLRYVEPFVHPGAIPCVALLRNDGWQQSILSLLWQIAQIGTNCPPGFELDIQALLLQAWRLLVLHSFSCTPVPIQDERETHVKAMAQYLKFHCGEPFHLDNLAKHINLSKSYCCRVFKRYMKCTISEYLLSCRLTQSTRLLLNTDETIAQIAYECGFGSTSYFIDRFRRKSGFSPQAYRKRQREKSAFSTTGME